MNPKKFVSRWWERFRQAGHDHHLAGEHVGISAPWCDLCQTEVPSELIVEPGQFEGYYFDALLEEMDYNEAQRFSKWMRGQTMALVNGRSLVYRWDWERYQAGLPVID